MGTFSVALTRQIWFRIDLMSTKVCFELIENTSMKPCPFRMYKSLIEANWKLVERLEVLELDKNLFCSSSVQYFQCCWCTFYFDFFAIKIWNNISYKAESLPKTYLLQWGRNALQIGQLQIWPSVPICRHRPSRAWRPCTRADSLISNRSESFQFQQ